MENTAVMDHTEVEDKKPQLRLVLGPEETDCFFVLSSNQKNVGFGCFVVLVLSKEKTPCLHFQKNHRMSRPEDETPYFFPSNSFRVRLRLQLGQGQITCFISRYKVICLNTKVNL